MEPAIDRHQSGLRYTLWAMNYHLFTGMDTYAANCLIAAMRSPRLYTHPEFFTAKIQTRQTGSFVLCTQYDILPAFYALPASRTSRHYLQGPFLARIAIIAIRNKSYVIEVKVYDVISKKPLVRERSHAILVNLVTRKSQSFDKNSQIYTIAREFTQRRANTDTFNWSSDDFTCDVNEQVLIDRHYVSVKPSDIDSNGHMNMSLYFKNAQQLVQRRHCDVTQFPRHSRPIRLSALFAKEAMVGDVLCFEACHQDEAVLVNIKKNNCLMSSLKFESFPELALQQLASKL